jgi:citrate synthase
VPSLRPARDSSIGRDAPVRLVVRGLDLCGDLKCRVSFSEYYHLLPTGEEPAAVADRIARTTHEAGAKVPGFGHPVHRPVDPRAERILALADDRGASGPHVLLARCLRDSVVATWRKPLPLNVSLPIAAVMLDLGFSTDAVKAIPILARTAGLLGHLAEERERPLGFLLAAAAEEAVDYEPDARA